MKREDIQINTLGELLTTDNLTNKVIYDLVLFEEYPGKDNENYCYGEIALPEKEFRNFFENNKGIRTFIPYSPHYKQLYVCFRKELEQIIPEYILNPGDNSKWFLVYQENEDKQKCPICISQYRQLNDEELYHFILHEHHLVVFSANETDLFFNTAKAQNQVFLLKASAGNLYQYPSTGVGLVDFLHSNFERTGLAQKLQEEFDNDKMIVNEAYMDSITGDLFLNVTEKNE